MNEDIESLCNITEVALQNMRRGLTMEPDDEFTQEAIDKNTVKHLLVANRSLAKIHEQMMVPSTGEPQ
jgi:hypothetical protein